jgi:D-sedoheptulose 7-phosphate isomerase
MNYINELCERYSELSPLAEAIKAAVDKITETYAKGGKILLCGNGGSAADCEHISGEMLKGFILKRTPEGEELSALASTMGEAAYALQRGIPAIPLTSLSASGTAFANDVDPALTYAQLTYALGKRGDVLIAISTSGNAKNVIYAVKAAGALGITTVALTGKNGGELGKICDISIVAPANETYKIQEYHLPIYHAICAEVERILFE